MCECRKCGLTFRTRTELKDHEFDCRNYISLQAKELEEVKQKLSNVVEFNYNVIPDTFKDYENIIHKSVHFELHIKFSNNNELEITDKSESLHSGHLNETDDIIKYIENELIPKEYTDFERDMIRFYSEC